MAVKSGVSINRFVQSINEELALKQDLLVAGDYIKIFNDPDNGNKLTITAEYQPVSVYSLTFSESDFTSGKLTISVATHLCGSVPVLRYIQEGSDENGWENVIVDFKMDKDGNITIESNPFNGRLLLDSQFAKAADVSALTQNILTGSVA